MLDHFVSQPFNLHLLSKLPSDFHLSAPYTRPLSGTLESCYPLLPYGMAISKGSPPDTTEGSVTKKPRTVFSPKQLLYLEEEFLKNQFPNMEHRKKIAKHLDLTQQHIQVRVYSPQLGLNSSVDCTHASFIHQYACIFVISISLLFGGSVSVHMHTSSFAFPSLFEYGSHPTQFITSKVLLICHQSTIH